MSEKSNLTLSSLKIVFHLEIHQGEQTHILPIDKKIFIGSGEDAEIKLSDIGLLPKHILIQLKNNLPTVKLAAQSINVKLNDAELNPNQDYLLKPGDQISIADVLIKICQDNEDALEIIGNKTTVQKIAEAFTSVSSILKLRKNSAASTGLSLEGTRTKVNKALTAVKKNQQSIAPKNTNVQNSKYYAPSGLIVRTLAFILDVAMAYAWAVTVLPMLGLSELWPTLSRELLKQIPLPQEFLVLQDIFPSYLIFFMTKLFFVIVFKRSFGQLVTGMKLAEKGFRERAKAPLVWLVDFLFSWTIIVNIPALIKKRTLKEFLLRTSFSAPPKLWATLNFISTPLITILLFLSPIFLTTNIVFTPIADININPGEFVETPDPTAQYLFIAQSGLTKWIGPGAYFKDLLEKKYLILPTLQNNKMQVQIFDKMKNTQVTYFPETTKMALAFFWSDLMEDIFLNNYTPFLSCHNLPTKMTVDSPFVYDSAAKTCLKELIISSLKISTEQFMNIDFWEELLLERGPFPTTLITLQQYLTTTLPQKLGLETLNSVRFIQMQNQEYLELKGGNRVVLISLEENHPTPLHFAATGSIDHVYKEILVQVQNKQSEANLLNPTPTINLFAPLDEMYALVTKKIKILEGDRAQNLLQFYTWQQDHLGESPAAKELYKKSLEDFMTLQEGQILSKSLQELLNKLEQATTIPAPSL